uniref:Uncharacterized protein n=1 Tax=Arundo donax TaxID=35708 RepID=A0A0A9FH66_ARUDO
MGCYFSLKVYKIKGRHKNMLNFKGERESNVNSELPVSKCIHDLFDSMIILLV